jgi:hypothetical protein
LNLPPFFVPSTGIIYESCNAWYNPIAHWQASMTHYPKTMSHYRRPFHTQILSSILAAQLSSAAAEQPLSRHLERFGGNS